MTEQLRLFTAPWPLFGEFPMDLSERRLEALKDCWKAWGAGAGWLVYCNSHLGRYSAKGEFLGDTGFLT